MRTIKGFLALAACAWFASASAQYVPLRDGLVIVASAPAKCVGGTNPGVACNGGTACTGGGACTPDSSCTFGVSPAQLVRAAATIYTCRDTNPDAYVLEGFAGGGAAAFSALTGGTNNSAAMVVGTGASIAPSGTGTIAATSVPGAGVSGNIAGNAGTATALAADPADCTAGQAANGVNASGTATGCVNLAATYQPLDTAELSSIASLVSAADRLPYYTGSGTAALATFTAAGRALVDDADATAQRSTLGLVIGTNVQAWDADLDDLADGSLSGSKVGTGIDGGNVSTGTVADARVASTITRDSEVTTADAAGDTTTFPLLGGAATGFQPPLTDGGLAYNATTDILTVTGGIATGAGTDNTRGWTSTDNSANCADPAAGDTSVCTIAGELYIRDTGGASREVLYTAGGDYTDFTCSAGTCTIDANVVTGAKSDSNTQGFIDGTAISCSAASDAGKMAISGAGGGNLLNYCSNSGTILNTVVNLSSSQTITGNKTVNGITIVQRLNDAYNSSSYADIATALAALPTQDGALSVTPTEDDAARFAATNPAGVARDGTTATGKKDALVIDERDGRLKFISSARPPWSAISTATTHASAADVPFVFKAQYWDRGDLFPDDAGDGTRDGDSWSCGQSYKSCSTTTTRECVIDSDCPVAETCTGTDISDGPSCPSGGATGGTDSQIKDYWYSGFYNIDNSTNGNYMGPGPAIFQVQGPDIDDGDGVQEAGESVDKPILSVGLTGVAIYMPETHGDKNYSYFTIFRSNDDPAWSTNVKNTPFLAVSKQGLFVDGGAFFGNATTWIRPDGSGTQYSNNSFNAFVHKDVANSTAAFVVEGVGNTNAGAEDGPLVWFQSSANATTGGTNHTVGTNVSEAFGFYENSRLRLAAKCNVAGGTCTGTTLDSQIIEFEGMTEDANETRIGVVEPTADRTFEIPNASGVAVVAAKDVTTTGALLWGDAADATDTGNEVCALAGLTCVDVKLPNGTDSDCTTDQGTAGTVFYAMCRES